ncbi:C-terminal binding protein [Puniceibacterium sp. IMCC21224]|uniref:C-terminal binding protein n=1 Tax=Puniceibacterium sp. IMCC21224 TaxID=1618204 RepID=UPI00064D988F|nr:C-terminal binding protein [Puniceibacterium sp. IMCC21224]KMK69035.1 lactate dehydrogenase-like oxidoreductase [Puniceibacterium sp. IMCC21224]
MPTIAIIDPQFGTDLALESSIAGPEYNFLTLAPSEGAFPEGLLSDVVAIIHCRSRNKLSECQLSQFPALSAVIQAGVGTDHIDIGACAMRGIPVCNVPDYGTREIADHAMALILDLRRGITVQTERIRRTGAWSPFAVPNAPIARLSGQTLGIVGLGWIGTALALRAKAFGIRVCFYDPYAAPGQDIALGLDRIDSLQGLVSQSDIISFHCPLTSSTKNLVNQELLAYFKPGSILINTARGGIVDLSALLSALKDGSLAGAGLDVLAEEPPNLNHPLLRAWTDGDEWLNGRLIITPHAAFFSPESVEDLRRLSIVTAIKIVNGDEPRTVIASTL